MLDIKATMQAIFANNKEKGFWDKERNKGEMLMLVVSELSEALEADRKDRYAKHNMEGYDTKAILNGEITSEDNEHPDSFWKRCFIGTVKDTFEDELADAVIRLFDICEGLGIDLEYHIQAKMKFNAMREKMHGKKY